MTPAHQPRKRFGQHFLHDDRVIARIVDAFRPGSGDRVVEIGPGRGALTLALLRHVASLHAVEIDRDLIPILRHIGGQQLEIHQADALKFDFCRLTEPPHQLRIIGNLPYNISTPLLFHLLDACPCIQDMLFMLQKEVVDRLAAQPGGSTYGRLSVMVQWRCRVEQLFEVPSSAFSPPPKVESAVVQLTPYRSDPVAVSDPGCFAEIVRAAFAQRRKTLRNSIGRLVTPHLITQAGIDPGQRAETLGIADFATLSNLAAAARHCSAGGNPDNGGGDT